MTMSVGIPVKYRIITLGLGPTQMITFFKVQKNTGLRPETHS